MSKKKSYQPPLQHNEQYYMKRGKRYYPVNDPCAYDGLGQGSWLVVVDKGCKSIRTQLNPKLAELDAALKYLEEGLCKAMNKVSEMRPKDTPISKKEQKAWKTFKATMGKDMPNLFTYTSHWEIATKGCEYIKQIMLENNMNIEKIKEKYEVKRREIRNAIESLEV